MGLGTSFGCDQYVTVCDCHHHLYRLPFHWTPLTGRIDIALEIEVVYILSLVVFRLGLKDQQEREIVHILMDCCLQEKTYNPFYAFLASKFCSYERRFQVM